MKTLFLSFFIILSIESLYSQGDTNRSIRNNVGKNQINVGKIDGNSNPVIIGGNQYNNYEIDSATKLKLDSIIIKTNMVKSDLDKMMTKYLKDESYGDSILALNLKLSELIKQNIHFKMLSDSLSKDKSKPVTGKIQEENSLCISNNSMSNISVIIWYGNPTFTGERNEINDSMRIQVIQLIGGQTECIYELDKGMINYCVTYTSTTGSGYFIRSMLSYFGNKSIRTGKNTLTVHQP